MMSARMRLVFALERDVSEDVRAVFVRSRLTFANERLVFARGRSKSRDRPSMETFDCRMDGGRRRLAVRPGREKAGEASRLAPLYLCLIPRPRFGVRAILAHCKSLIGGLYLNAGGQSDSFLVATEAKRQQSFEIRRRALLDGLGKSRVGALCLVYLGEPFSRETLSPARQS